MKRLLFIAYHFPPHGGAGVQRSLKFVKYLPTFGIRPTVLTDVGATDRKWSPPDPTLAQEIPAGIRVVRTPWSSPAAADRKAAAEQRLALAARVVAEERIEAILVSMSPFSDADFAARLAAHCRLPWIADLRDPWALDEFQVYRTRWHRQRALDQMRQALRTASLIVMNTPEAASALKRTFPEFAGRAISITNGYDAADFPPLADTAPNEHFTVVHAGFLHATAGLRQRRQMWQYRLLGRMARGVEILPRSHYYLLRALEEWQAAEPAIAEHVRVRLIGEPRPHDRELVAASPVAPLVSFTGYLPHHDSVRLMRSADLLFLPMHKLPPGRRATIVPGKTYEYLASGRPVLAPVPDGDARDFLERARTGLLCPPDSTAEMTRCLRQQYRLWREHGAPPAPDLAFVRRFERRELTRCLAEALHALPPTGEPTERPPQVLPESAIGRD